jgi:hypothetical protein
VSMAGLIGPGLICVVAIVAAIVPQALPIGPSHWTSLPGPCGTLPGPRGCGGELLLAHFAPRGGARSLRLRGGIGAGGFAAGLPGWGRRVFAQGLGTAKEYEGGIGAKGAEESSSHDINLPWDHQVHAAAGVLCAAELYPRVLGCLQTGSLRAVSCVLLAAPGALSR